MTFAKRWYRADELDAENARRAELNKPLPKPDPELMKPTAIRVLKPFMHEGRPVTPGDLIRLPAHVATDVCYQKKAELV
jgi:hypothetical protein